MYEVLSFDVGIRNLAYCVMRKRSMTAQFEVCHWEVIDLQSQTLSDITQTLVRELNARKYLLNVPFVLIESQNCSNALMRSVAHSIQTFFLTRALLVKPRAARQEVLFVNPRHKLTVVDSQAVVTASTPYKRNKKLAVMHCHSLIQDNPGLLEFFNRLRKKDDLADAFLQGAYFIRERFARDAEKNRNLKIDLTEDA